MFLITINDVYIVMITNEELGKRFEVEIEKIRTDLNKQTMEKICNLVKTFDKFDESGEFLNSVIDKLQSKYGRIILP